MSHLPQSFHVLAHKYFEMCAFKSHCDFHSVILILSILVFNQSKKCYGRISYYTESKLPSREWFCLYVRVITFLTKISKLCHYKLFTVITILHYHEFIFIYILTRFTCSCSFKIVRQSWLNKDSFGRFFDVQM